MHRPSSDFLSMFMNKDGTLHEKHSAFGTHSALGEGGQVLSRRKSGFKHDPELVARLNPLCGAQLFDEHVT